MCNFAGCSCEPATVPGSPLHRSSCASNIADALAELTWTLKLVNNGRKVNSTSLKLGEKSWNAPGLSERFAWVSLNKARFAVGLPQVVYTTRQGFDAEVDAAIQQTVEVIADLLSAVIAANASGDDTAARFLLLLVFILRDGEDVCGLAWVD